MSVFRRMRDITVANLNERLEQSQDPVKLIDQFLHSTREEISEAERLYQQYASHTIISQSWLYKKKLFTRKNWSSTAGYLNKVSNPCLNLKDS